MTKTELVFYWYSGDDGNGTVLEQHKQELDQHALSEIIKKRVDWYTGGELNCEINGVYYYGSWEYKETEV